MIRLTGTTPKEQWDRQTYDPLRIGRFSTNGKTIIVDPCAGDGAAVYDFGKALFDSSVYRRQVLNTDGQEVASSSYMCHSYGYAPEYYANELEESRAKTLKRKLGGSSSPHVSHPNLIHGDAFKLLIRGQEHGATLLYLNPPYHLQGEWEYNFLERFTDSLHAEGVLVYLIPVTALKKSAVYLSKHYRNIVVRAFPKGDYEAYKQVVVYATKRSIALREPDTDVVHDLEALWANPNRCKPLTAFESGLVECNLDYSGRDGLAWTPVPDDLEYVIKHYKPLHGLTGQPLSEFGLQLDIDDLLRAEVHPAMPLKPAHLSQALAVGIINGVPIYPNKDIHDTLPPVLVKGVFERELKKTQEKTDKKGNVKSTVFVEQPKLRLTCLDLRSGMYYELIPTTTVNTPPAIDRLSIGDFVTYYRDHLLTIMDTQAVPLHDPRIPEHHIQMPAINRRPYTMQKDAAMGAVKLLARDGYAQILGEVGTGKTGVTAWVSMAFSPENLPTTRAEMRRLGVTNRKLSSIKKVLVMCPTHLTQHSWPNEWAEVYPDVPVFQIDTISDVKAFAAYDGFAVGVLSKERAKLGHAYEGVDLDNCPKCGAPILGSPEVLARKHARCEGHMLTPANADTKTLVELAEMLSGATTYAVEAAQSLPKQSQKKQLAAKIARFKADETDEAMLPKRSLVVAMMNRCAQALYHKLSNNSYETPNYTVDKLMKHAMAYLGWCPEVEAIVERMLEADMRGTGSYGMDDFERHSAPTLMMGKEALESWMPRWKEFAHGYGFVPRYNDNQAKKYRAERLTSEDFDRGYTTKWDSSSHAYAAGRYGRTNYTNLHALGWIKARAAAEASTTNDFVNPTFYDWSETEYDRIPFGDVRHLDKMFYIAYELTSGGQWLSEDCGEHLYFAVPKPRRTSIAKYIARKFPNLIDLLILDESHEYNSLESAQEIAAHRLTKRAKYVLECTGTNMNGYADSLFRPTWERDLNFRGEFDRTQLVSFIKRYGYRKIEVDQDGKDKLIMDDFGAHTDLKSTNASQLMRQVGRAPGVSPTFVLQYVLPSAVLMLKSDMDAELPAYSEQVIRVKPSEEQENFYKSLRNDVLTNLKHDRGTNNAGKLLGALGRVPSSLDICTRDTGNAGGRGERHYEFGYPTDEKGIKDIVQRYDLLDPYQELPKEEALIELVEAQLERGRPVCVLVMNTGDKEFGLDNRLERILQSKFGNIVARMDSKKVKAVDRQAWIDREVVSKRKQVLIVNPVAIQTGLNNLVYFPTWVWFQNPECNATVYRQTMGRGHRPKQTKDVEVYLLAYKGTTQVLQLDLLANKVQVAKAADGSDIMSALGNVGADETSGMEVLAIGQLIYDTLLSEG